MSLITTSFGAWAGSGVGQPSTDGARQAQMQNAVRRSTAQGRAQSVAASLAKRSEKGATLGDKVFGHVAGVVLLPYYMS